MTNLIRRHWKYWILRSCYWYDHNKASLIHIDWHRQNIQIISPISILGSDEIHMYSEHTVGLWDVVILSLRIARLWVSHCNTIFHTEYAMNPKTQPQAVVCVWAWISNKKKKTLNKYKHWTSWSCASINPLRSNDAIWRPRSRSKLVYVTAGLPDGTKPLAKPIHVLTHWHLRDLIKNLNELFKANISDWWLSYMLRNCPQTNVVGHY